MARSSASGATTPGSATAARCRAGGGVVPAGTGAREAAVADD